MHIIFIQCQILSLRDAAKSDVPRYRVDMDWKDSRNFD